MLGQDQVEVQADVYWRKDLTPGDRLAGPALIVEMGEAVIHR